MRNKLLCLIFFVFAFNLHAQDKSDRETRHEKIKAYKTAYITDKIAFTDKQVQTFWPVYYEFDHQRYLNYKQQRNLNRKNNPKEGEKPSKDEIIKNQESIILLKEEAINIEKKFRSKLLTIITAEQYSQLMEAEREFHDLLIKRLKKDIK